MRIGWTADHAGFALKEFLKPRVEDMGHENIDLGVRSDAEQVDYPLATLRLADLLASGAVDRAIYVCGNGYAMAMLANRVPGVRAAVCHDVFTARTCVEMGAANAMSLGSRVVGSELASDLVQTWLGASFLGDTVERYRRRLEQVESIDGRVFGGTWRTELRRYLAEHPASELDVPRPVAAETRSAE